MHDALLVVPVVFIVFIVLAVIMVTPYWKIFQKLGFSKWLALLMLVPLVNLIMLYVVAFSNPAST